MKIYFVANARMPSEKAHGIHIAKMCEALIENGDDVTLVVPSRTKGSIKDFYGLRVEVPVARIRVPNFYTYGRIGYAISSACFMLGYFFYFLFKRAPLIYTVDIDTFSHALLSFCGDVIAEMHSPKRSTFSSRFFFNRAQIVATNELIAHELKKTFGINDILIEPNGVDESFFDIKGGGTGALYVGRVYKWKGLEILPQMQHVANVPVTVLGGTREEFETLFGAAENLQFAQSEPKDVPAHIARAAVLLLVGTKKNESSNRYTSPMKVFEYLASGRPVVASDTEALRSIVSREAAVFVPPDDPVALAHAVKDIIARPQDFAHNVEVGRALAREHTWSARARRIINHFA